MESKYQKRHYEDVASLLCRWAMEMYGEPLHVCPEHPDWDGGDAPWQQCHDPTDHVGTDGEEAPSACRCTSGQPSIHHLFADLFAADNPLFDRERFLKACGLEEA